MKPQFLNQIIPSFYLFLDHEILSKGEAFTNYSGQLYSTVDPNFRQYNIWGSPFRQWVSDTSINNAFIPSGAYSYNNFISKGTSGLSLDYSMGRIITSGSVSTSTSFTINYAFKDINIYYTDAIEEKLLFESKWDLRPTNNFYATGSLDWRSIPYPCLLIKTSDAINNPYAFGGLDISEISVRTILLTDSNYLLDASLSILNDTSRKVFPLFSYFDLPFNVFGDYKSGLYNYNSLSSQYDNGSDLIIINRTYISKFNSNINKLIGNGIYAAFCDFDLCKIRTPRS